MSEFYKITEIAKLYGLCTDTLRYYEEQGLLSPTRGQNNYRIYGLQDICNLNIIRDLRSLDMPTSEIRKYVEKRTISSTCSLLRQESELIEKRIAQLKESAELIRQQLDMIAAATAMPAMVPSFKNYPARPCFRLSEDIILSEDVDFVLKRLETAHEDVLHTLGNQQIGATLDSSYIEKGFYDHFQSVFFISETGEGTDSEIPAGEFACMVYHGEYGHIREVCLSLEEFIQEEGREAIGPPMEIYHIDMYETRLRSEYITEVQIPVQKKESTNKNRHS